MKQIIQSFKTGELWLGEVPVPACKSGGAIVQTTTSFVSAGTERMLVDFARKGMLGKAITMPDQVKKVIRKMKTEGIFETLEKVKTKLDQPIPLGYSSAGIIEEVGYNIQGLAVGDRVACGGAGYANHADYNYVPRNLIVKIPENVSFEDASCATVGSVALQGIRQSDLRLGENVCVMGLGLLGILAVQMAKASGCRVIGFDPNPQRCKQAEELGADLAVNDDLEAACAEFSEGNGVDAVLITAATKSNEPVTVAGEIACHRGKVVVTGMVGMNIPRDQYYKKELDFKLSLSYGPGRYDTSYEEGGNDYPFGYVRWTEQRNMQAFLNMVAGGTVTPSKLITHRFEIDNALDAYDLLMGKKEEPYLGIVLNYSDTKEKLERRKTYSTGIESDNSNINLGFIGVGNFAKAVLLPELKKRDNVNLKAICTATGMNCGETAKKENFEYATTDYQKLLKDESVNTVFIATQHNSHSKFICDALSAGKNVFVEKPLAINEEQLNQLIQKCDELSNKKILPFLMVGFNRRFSPHARLIKDYFAERKTPMFVNYRINAGIIPPDVWIQDLKVGGGRIVGEGCHFIDFASYLIGCDVTEVQAMCVETNNSALIAEDNVNISLKYQDGSIASIQYIAVGSADVAKEYCEVYADESTAVMNDFCKTVCSGKQGKKKLSGKQAKGFTEEIDEFLKTVKGESDKGVSVASFINTTQATIAARKAIQSQTIIKI